MKEIKSWNLKEKSSKPFSEIPICRSDNKIIYGQDTYGFMFLARYDSKKDLIKYNNKLYEPHIVFLAISSKDVDLNDSNYNIKLTNKDNYFNTVYFNKNYYENCDKQICFIKAALLLYKINIVEFIPLNEGRKILAKHYKQFEEISEYAECVTYNENDFLV